MLFTLSFYCTSFNFAWYIIKVDAPFEHAWTGSCNRNHVERQSGYACLGKIFGYYDSWFWICRTLPILDCGHKLKIFNATIYLDCTNVLITKFGSHAYIVNTCFILNYWRKAQFMMHFKTLKVEKNQNGYAPS